MTGDADMAGTTGHVEAVGNADISGNTDVMNSAGGAAARALAALKRYFGYDSFRPGQEGVVETIMSGRDVLGVMPTGAGKSVCYQIPAALLPGVTIVVSPLISLMRDQVDALNDAGLSSAYINTTQDPHEQGMVLAQAAAGQVKLLYVAPERLETERFRRFAAHVPIALIAVDEAHCVSQWGQDFRSAYLGIGEFIASLPQRPAVAAFTATATERVRRDIVTLLGLRDPLVTVTGFDRPNLYFDVIRLENKHKAAWVAQYIAAHPQDSGIVYCSTRKETEALAEAINRTVPQLRGAAGEAVRNPGRSRSPTTVACWPTDEGGRNATSSPTGCRWWWPPTPSAWASTNRTCASSSTTTCRKASRPTIRRRGAPAATANPAGARCCGTRAIS